MEGRRSRRVEWKFAASEKRGSVNRAHASRASERSAVGRSSPSDGEADSLGMDDPAPRQERPPNLIRLCLPPDSQDGVQILFQVDRINQIFRLASLLDRWLGSKRTSGGRKSTARLTAANGETAVQGWRRRALLRCAVLTCGVCGRGGHEGARAFGRLAGGSG